MSIIRQTTSSHSLIYLKKAEKKLAIIPFLTKPDRLVLIVYTARKEQCMYLIPYRQDL